MKRREKARELAKTWQNNQSEKNRSFMYYIKWEIIFRKIARKYNLVKEFLDNGIIGG